MKNIFLVLACLIFSTAGFAKKSSRQSHMSDSEKETAKDLNDYSKAIAGCTFKITGSISEDGVKRKWEGKILIGPISVNPNDKFFIPIGLHSEGNACLKNTCDWEAADFHGRIDPIKVEGIDGTYHPEFRLHGTYDINVVEFSGRPDPYLKGEMDYDHIATKEVVDGTLGFGGGGSLEITFPQTGRTDVYYPENCPKASW